MSYIVYFNGQKLLLNSQRPIAQTKQANDLATLDNRQSNFTNRIVVPFNATNDKIFQNLSMVGNQSNVPYQKNRVDIIDAETGKHLIFNGWGYVSKTTNRGYELNCYDGIIDFYRRIENLNISQVGVNELNHLKNMETVIDSFTNDELKYKYIVADYNGKAIVDGKINIDYLVPSARKSYIWNRIHEFAGFTFEGQVFNSERFLNNFITYPKPIPTTEPSLIEISNQTSVPYASGSDFFNSYTVLNFFPFGFSDLYANNNNGEINKIYITTPGTYKLQMNGDAPTVNYIVYNSAMVEQRTGTINPQINEAIYLGLAAGDIVLMYHFIPTMVNPMQSVDSVFSFVEGYYANFDEVLIDFMAKDFVNELMVEFGLTAFKDKYRNHIVYKNLDEILQDDDVVDWSNKFVKWNGESYSIGNYAKKNTFKYRYNDENLKYNDGFISINNENLADEKNVVSSKYYTPDRPVGTFYSSMASNLYKIWEKELKDDGTVEYKELSGRYYCLRYKEVLGVFDLVSEALSVSETVSSIPYESYLRLDWRSLIIDNYKSIESIFDKAKVRDAVFNLSFQDYENFNLEKLIFVNKLSSYYLVNKIKSFVKGQPSTVELIEVDYFKELQVIEPIDRNITITNIVQASCELTFEVETNIEQPTEILIQPYAITPDGAGGFYYAPYGEPIPATLSGNEVVHVFTELPEMLFGGYKFKLVYFENLFQLAESNLYDTVINISGSCYVAPPTAPPTLSYITITEVETLSIINGGNLRNVRVHYVSDLSDAFMNLLLTATNLTFVGFITTANNILASQNGYIDILLANNALSGGPAFYNLQLSSMGINSNIANS